jgi:F-type H+-transporting ATPase subunit b
MAEAHPAATEAVPHEGAVAPGHNELTAATEDHGGGHAEAKAWGLDAAGWVSLAMLALFLLMIWKKVPAAIGKALDRKIASIRLHLDEAAQIRADAEALRAEYEAKAAGADAEIALLLERARNEAAGIVSEAEHNAAVLVENRARMAENRIETAERAVINEVRAKVAEVAAAAAERLIRERLDAGADKAMIDATIGDLGRR